MRIKTHILKHPMIQKDHKRNEKILRDELKQKLTHQKLMGFSKGSAQR